MRLAPHVLLLLASACSSEGMAREPAAVLVAHAPSTVALPRSPAIVPIPTAPVVVATVAEPRQRRSPKIFYGRGFTAVGCGRG